MRKQSNWRPMGKNQKRRRQVKKERQKKQLSCFSSTLLSIALLHHSLSLTLKSCAHSYLFQIHRERKVPISYLQLASCLQSLSLCFLKVNSIFFLRSSTQLLDSSIFLLGEAFAQTPCGSGSCVSI